MFRVGLFVFGALRGLWGFCARVELGGLEACGVFAPVFPFVLCFSSSSPIFLGFVFVVLGLSCLFVLFVLVSLWVFVFSFSLAVYAQKERALRVGASSLFLLWVCYILVNSSK